MIYNNQIDSPGRQLESDMASLSNGLFLNFYKYQKRSGVYG